MFAAQLNWFSECYEPHKKIVSFVILGSLIGAGLGLLSPMLIRHIMDELLPNGISTNMIVVAAGLLLVYAASYYLNYKVECLGRGMGARIEFSMREKLFRHMLNHNGWLRCPAFLPQLAARNDCDTSAPLQKLQNGDDESRYEENVHAGASKYR